MAKYIKVDDSLLVYLSQEAYDQVQKVPAADVRPVVRGSWESHTDLHHAVCTNCHAWWIPYGEGYKKTYRFCPNCGAYMREEEQDG